MWIAREGPDRRVPIDKRARSVLAGRVHNVAVVRPALNATAHRIRRLSTRRSEQVQQQVALHSPVIPQLRCKHVVHAVVLDHVRTPRRNVRRPSKRSDRRGWQQVKRLARGTFPTTGAYATSSSTFAQHCTIGVVETRRAWGPLWGRWWRWRWGRGLDRRIRMHGKRCPRRVAHCVPRAYRVGLPNISRVIRAWWPKHRKRLAGLVRLASCLRGSKALVAGAAGSARELNIRCAVAGIAGTLAGVAHASMGDHLHARWRRATAALSSHSASLSLLRAARARRCGYDRHSRRKGDDHAAPAHPRHPS